jgi:hypothetical protein
VSMRARIFALIVLPLVAGACFPFCGEGYLGTLRCDTDEECQARIVDAGMSNDAFGFCKKTERWKNDRGQGICFWDSKADAGIDAGASDGGDGGASDGGDAGADAGVDAGVDAGSKWVRFPVGTTKTLYGVWGTSSNDVWVVGEQGTMLHWNGANWAATNPATALDLTGVSGSSATNVIAAGAAGTVLRWNGSSWTTEDAGVTRDFRTAAVGDSAHAWVAGSFGSMVFWDGTRWFDFSGMYPSTQINGSWASGSAFWFVGSSGFILHGVVFGGSGFPITVVPVRGDAGTVTTDLNAVATYSSGPALRWAVGNGNTVLMSDSGVVPGATDAGFRPSEWILQTGCGSTDLFGVWVTSATNGWAVGKNGTICHWDGTSWSAVSSGAGSDLRGIWGPNAGEIWAVGVGGMILHYVQ